MGNSTVDPYNYLRRKVQKVEMIDKQKKLDHPFHGTSLGMLMELREMLIMCMHAEQVMSTILLQEGLVEKPPLYSRPVSSEEDISVLINGGVLIIRVYYQC